MKKKWARQRRREHWKKSGSFKKNVNWCDKQGWGSLTKGRKQSGRQKDRQKNRQGCEGSLRLRDKVERWNKEGREGGAIMIQIVENKTPQNIKKLSPSALPSNSAPPASKSQNSKQRTRMGGGVGSPQPPVRCLSALSPLQSSQIHEVT